MPALPFNNESKIQAYDIVNFVYNMSSYNIEDKPKEFIPVFLAWIESVNIGTYTFKKGK